MAKAMQGCGERARDHAVFIQNEDLIVNLYDFGVLLMGVKNKRISLGLSVGWIDTPRRTRTVGEVEVVAIAEVARIRRFG